MVAPAGMRNFCGTLRWSVRYQLPMFTFVAFGLYNSTESTWGRSVWVNASLIRTTGILRGTSFVRGAPPMKLLARQFAELFGSELKFGLVGTSENPVPSAAAGQGGRVS